MTRADKIFEKMAELPKSKRYVFDKMTVYTKTQAEELMKVAAWGALIFGMDTSDLEKQKEIFEIYWNEQITDTDSLKQQKRKQKEIKPLFT